MSLSTYRTTIFGRVEDLPPPPSVAGLRVSGLSVMCYIALRLKHHTLARAAEKGSITISTGGNSYSDKLTDINGISYSELLPAGHLPGPLAFAAHAKPGPITQNLVWLDDEYALSVVPLIFSSGGRSDSLPGVELSRPLDISDLLEIMRQATDSKTAQQIRRQAVSALVAHGVLSEQDVLSAWPVHMVPAIQIWDLRGTDRSAVPYDGIGESRRFCWEISTMMAYAADHVLYDGLWQRRSPDQVFNDVSTGFSVLGDHMVFVNSSCCLEISHLPIDLRARSEFRLKSYGYDSSSIFIWTVANLRLAIIEDLERRYRQIMEDLTTRRSIPPGRKVQISKDHLRHSALLSQLQNFRHLIREPRNRVFDEEVAQLRLTDNNTSTANREMERVVQLAVDLSQARDQLYQARSNTLLAALAAGLAISGIPQLVEQVSVWLRVGEWQKIGISCILGLAVASVIFRIWRTYR